MSVYDPPLERFPGLVAELQRTCTGRDGKLSAGQIKLAAHAAALDEESREQATGETAGAGKPDMMKPPEPAEPESAEGGQAGIATSDAQRLWDEVLERHR